MRLLVVAAAFIQATDADYIISKTGMTATHPELAAQVKIGCHTVSPGTATTNSFDMLSSTGCGSDYCPFCFLLDTSINPVEMTIKFGATSVFARSTGATVLGSYQFTNAGSMFGSVTDGSNTYIIMPMGQRGSSIECNAFANNAATYLAYLACDASVTPRTTVNSLTSNTASTNCLSVTHLNQIPGTGTTCGLAAGGCTLDFTINECNSRYCPQCYIFDALTEALKITFTNCQTFYKLGQTGIIIYDFSNEGTYLVEFGDGTNTFTLAPKGVGTSRATCTCSANLLSCDLPTSNSQANFAQSLSVAGVGYMFGNARVYEKIEFDDANSYMMYNSTNGIQTYVKTGGSTTRSLQLGQGEGTLHGQWYVDATLVSSDKRLKRAIEPLANTLRDLAAERGADADIGSAAGLAGEEAGEAPGAGVAWLLRHLRPVSYFMKGDAQGRHRRFGFVADELLEYLPNLVHLSADENRTKRVYMTDFIAILVAMVQHQQHGVEAFSKRLDAKDDRLAAGSARQSAFEARLLRLDARMESCCKVAKL